MANKALKRKDVAKVPAILVVVCRTLELLSPKMAALFAARLFTSPLKYRMPKRELEMDSHSRQEIMRIKSINKDIVVYHYGTSSRKILLVHGWSGRGTQLVKFADACIAAGFSTISFDAPAHGKSPGKTTLMPEFVASILEIESQYGPLHSAIGHSLGGMSLLNAAKRGFKTNKMAIIGSGDVIQDILDDFTDKLGLKRKTGLLMRVLFEKSGETMDSYSSYIAAQKVAIPVLVIHDENDSEVPVKCARHIIENLELGELVITKGLGHRKILGNPEVITKTIEFIKN